MQADATASVELLTLVLTFYLTIGIMGIGVAVMWDGENGARRAARLFFLRPVQWLVQRTRAALVAIVLALRTPLTRVIVRPVAAELKELAADSRWLASRGRGWLQRGRRR